MGDFFPSDSIYFAVLKKKGKVSHVCQLSLVFLPSLQKFINFGGWGLLSIPPP